MKKLIILPILLFLISACTSDGEVAEFTGNEISMALIPGNVLGNQTSGTLRVRELTGGAAKIEVSLNGVIQNANHPVHLHYGSLADDGNIATILNPVVDIEGKGESSTVLSVLENGETLSYSQFLTFNGSLKVHFESTGALKDEILGSINIGINESQNQAYLDGTKSITICNSDF